MKRLRHLCLCLTALCIGTQLSAQEKTLYLEIGNPWEQDKTDYPVVVKTADLKCNFPIASATVYDGEQEIASQTDDLDRDGVSVALEVNHRREDERLEMFERLTWYKDVLEQDFPEELVWDVCFVRESGEEVARIYARQTGADFHRRSDWGTLFAFMARQMYLLERNFMGIAEYLRE